MGSDQVASKVLHVYAGEEGELPVHIGSLFDVPQELAEWWIRTGIEDLNQAAPKVTEYGGSKQGSADLRLMGDNLAELLGWVNAADDVKQELACWFYLQGKIARLVSNYQQQEAGKADTWHDATVYTLMARRLQQVRRWP